MATDVANPPAHGLRCPRCGGARLAVTTTRPLPGGRVRRYRRCAGCGQPVVTLEAPVRPPGK